MRIRLLVRSVLYCIHILWLQAQLDTGLPVLAKSLYVFMYSGITDGAIADDDDDAVVYTDADTGAGEVEVILFFVNFNSIFFHPLGEPLLILVFTFHIPSSCIAVSLDSEHSYISFIIEPLVFIFESLASVSFLSGITQFFQAKSSSEIIPFICHTGSFH